MREHQTVFSFDTGTLVALLEIELGQFRAIEWLLDAGLLQITDEVFQETKRNVPKSDSDARKLLFDKIKPLIFQDDLDLAENHLDRHVLRMGRTAEREVHEGEKSAAALAMHLAWKGQRYVAFVTDDFKAAVHIKYVFDIEQVGSVLSTYDLVCFLWTRFPSRITGLDAESAIRDITRRMLPKSGLSPYGAGSTVAEINLKKYRERIQLLASFVPQRGTDY